MDGAIEIGELGSYDTDRRFVAQLESNGYALISGVFTNKEWSVAIESAYRLFRCIDPIDLVRFEAKGGPFDIGFMPYGRALAGDTGLPNLLRAWTLLLDSPDQIPEEGLESWSGISHLGRKMRSAVHRMLSSIENGLPADTGCFTGTLADGLTMLVLDYPADLKATDARSRRQSNHTDPTLLSLLPLSSAAGLVVWKNGAWDAVEYSPDELLVMVGSSLQGLSGGALTACLHSARTPSMYETEDRSALVYFVSPDSAAVLDGGSASEGALRLTAGALQHQFFRERFAW